MKKRIFALLICLLMLLIILSGCGDSKPAPENSGAETRQFTDSCGRTVTIPTELTRIAVSGPLTQAYVYPLAADIMVGCGSVFSAEAEKYISEEFLALPMLGQLYGGKGTMDLEALLAAAPELVIDVGESKGSIAEDFDALTQQTGIPFVHIETSVTTAPAAYRLLGELTGKTEKAEALAKWCEDCLADINGMMQRVDADNARKSLIYSLGDKGLNCIAEGSFHAETINMLSDNAAKLPDVVSSGLGNEIDMEQLMTWNPEYIIFAYDSVYEDAIADPVWKQLDAVKNGHIFKSPFGPYGWLASPPSVQRYLGMVWLGALLYPDYVDYELKATVKDYYKLFYGYELSDADYAELTQNSMP